MDYITKILLTYNSKYVLNNSIFLLSLFIIFLLLIISAGKKYKYVNRGFLLTLIIYHTLISLFFYYYTLHGVSDSRAYYVSTVEHGREGILAVYGYDVYFIYFFLYPLIHYAKLTYLSCTLFFNFLGCIGLTLLYISFGSLVAHSKNAMKYLHLSLFIPGLSVFTGFIGKDPIIFFSLSLIIFSLLKFKSRFILFLFAFALLAHVRPYMIVISLCPLFLALLFNKDLGFTIKSILMVMFIVITLIVSQIFIEHYNVQQFKEAEQLVLSTQGVWGGGSDVDISHYNIVFKILTFLYRPFFFDAHNIMSFLSSCENILYVYLTFIIFSPNFCRYIFREKDFILRYNYFFFFIGTFIMSQANANLGTIVRKKVMIVPSLIALIVLYTAYRDKLTDKGKQ